MTILRAGSTKKFMCDGCEEVTELLDKGGHVPQGWVRVQRKDADGYWKVVLYACPGCAETVTGAFLNDSRRNS